MREMPMLNIIGKQACPLLVVLSLVGCNSISPFSPEAYKQDTSLKVEALNIMDKALEPYNQHQKDVEVIELEMEKAYEYSKGRPKNEETTRQWEIIKNPSRNSLGGFFKRWKGEKTLNSSFIQEAKGEVSDGFDQVIELESGKIKSSDAKN
jgi:hypothetical protein